MHRFSEGTTVVSGLTKRKLMIVRQSWWFDGKTKKALPAYQCLTVNKDGVIDSRSKKVRVYDRFVGLIG